MDDVVDVVPLRNLHDAQPGDLLVDGDAVVGTVITGRQGDLRVQLDGLPDYCARWSWTLEKIRVRSTSTVPVLAKMARVLRENGLHAPAVFHVCREVR